MSSSPRVVATLIARGGGSTFHRKNARLLGGKPVLRHAVENLLATDFITDVFVWTEDEELADIARAAGAQPLVRPRSMVHYSGGFHTLEEWYHNRAGQIHARIGQLGEFEVGYNCNNILVRPQSFNAMFRLLLNNAHRASRVQAVARVEPGLCMVAPAGQELFPVWNDPERTAQEHPPLFRMVGAVVNHRERCSDSRFRTLYHEISAEEALDFQHPDDVVLAEYALARRQAEGGRTCA